MLVELLESTEAIRGLTVGTVEAKLNVIVSIFWIWKGSLICISITLYPIYIFWIINNVVCYHCIHWTCLQWNYIWSIHCLQRLIWFSYIPSHVSESITRRRLSLLCHLNQYSLFPNLFIWLLKCPFILKSFKYILSVPATCYLALYFG